MILVDSNLLIYAYTEESPYQQRAKAWLSATLTGSGRVGIPWHTILSFLRITTSARVIANPPSVNDAWMTVNSWLNHPRVWVPQPTEHHAQLLGSLLTRFAPYSRMVNDAHLAALAIEHNLTLCSADGDFARFPGLRWENPLQP